MSQDRTTITRAEAIRRRKEEDQKKLDKLTFKKVSQTKYTPASQPAASSRRTETARNASPVSASRWARRYDIAMSGPHGQARSSQASKPAKFSFALPKIHFGPRGISFFLVLFCMADLFLMMNSDTFLVRNTEISGNQRISTEEIQSVLGIAGEPAAFIQPAQIQSNILAAFPDISDAQITVNFPNSVVISVTERTPVAAWQQNGDTKWIDATGFAFTPRGEIPGLPVVMASGAPPTPSVDPDKPANPQAFLPANLSVAIETLSTQLPQGASMIFDPQYGLGWNDPTGLKVYFGYSVNENSQKVKVYEAMLAYLSTKNIKPTIINVESPNAPFYRVEQ